MICFIGSDDIKISSDSSVNSFSEYLLESYFGDLVLFPENKSKFEALEEAKKFFRDLSVYDETK